jgi:TRAP-type mannitol/chloroaromatic compound transport system substrate-binding protein
MPEAKVWKREILQVYDFHSLSDCISLSTELSSGVSTISAYSFVPFGPPVGEFLGWKWFGGGNKLRDEIYAKHGLIAIDSFAIAPETSGWFRNEVKSVAELKGMKMRFFGLGAQVMQKLGVSTQLLAAADIYPALERGVIDATEFSMPMMDIKLGFHQVAKFNYFPGWHQSVSMTEIMMNKKVFDALPKSYKKILEIAAGNQLSYTYAETEATQFGVMAEMRDKHKVQVKRWKDSELAIFEKAWLDVIKEESATDPLFKRIADDYLAFRKNYAIWGDAQFMKPTYLSGKPAAAKK